MLIAEVALNFSWPNNVQSAVFAITEAPLTAETIFDSLFAKNVFPILFVLLEIDGARLIPFARI
jgi:hypothetical protein